jgi:hypothetical protein
MSPSLLRLIVFIVAGVALVLWPVPFLLVAFMLVIWLVPRSYRDHREIARLREAEQMALARAVWAEERVTRLQRRRPTQRRSGAAARVAELEAALVVAQGAIAALEQELEDARSSVNSVGSPGHPIFRRVGLDESCPKWVAQAVRREYRRRLHPDSKPPHQKSEAERRFKEAEGVFDEIWRARGF